MHCVVSAVALHAFEVDSLTSDYVYKLTTQDKRRQNSKPIRYSSARNELSDVYIFYSCLLDIHGVQGFSRLFFTRLFRLMSDAVSHVISVALTFSVVAL